MDKTRFVIIGGAHSGSTLLKNLLKTHPNIISYGELLNPSKIRWDYSQFNKELNSFAIHQFRKRETVDFMNLAYNPTLSSDVHCIGFESRYSHYEDPDGFPQALQFLLNDSSIKLIHIKQEIPFNACRSCHSSPMKSGGGMPAPEPCIKSIRDLLEQQEKFDRLFAGRESIDITYENLMSNTVLTTKRVLDFLDVRYTPFRLDTHQKEVENIGRVFTDHGEMGHLFSPSGLGFFAEN